MNNLLQSPEIWPVIHIDSKNPEMAMDNAKIVATCKCQGVFLISIEGDDDSTPSIAARIKADHPQLKVGINLLQHSPQHAVHISLERKLDATWADQTLFSDNPEPQQTDQIFRIQELLKNSPNHKFFTSVSFKYQKADPNPDQSAIRANSYNFIPTTSGPGTGKSASQEKLQKLRATLKKDKLAVASGVTPQNVAQHIGLITHILVATGISKSFHQLDETFLQTLMKNSNN